MRFRGKQNLTKPNGFTQKLDIERLCCIDMVTLELPSNILTAILFSRKGKGARIRVQLQVSYFPLC
jgi:hypothetical protein